ncbi:MAG: hypothetical protein H0T60_10315 [Acidobacteria bacterium]|nr:hypothetical protein [Acidobacteriota bacterium]
MSDAVFHEYARQAAAALVERETQRTGSRMAAYEIVSQTVGKSSDWLRRFIGRRIEVDLAAFNIAAQYDRLCSRIEADNETAEARANALKGQLDAAIPSTARKVLAVAAGTETKTPTPTDR